ncbi:hypothetical protein JY452_02790 [Stenotrophomonas maltophilia]|uniref:hypothetical protein n=1 Tax=Stenotrophomonas TaxID=40323 RepID=UPI0006C0D39A|nr:MULTISPECIES: hypothetical protein [Stenotrophomonas]KAA3597350.1 hypothetical protein D1178_19010 [Stenotrophomonas maltophilia]KOO78660.1 hypothetical protein VO93_08775 [Stenotrophomonas maltophilia]MBN5124933.1 hypothetical protein [Stenotrophomonas maltophilia]MBN5175740.1 hypothetical protein [Stenotrophomonas maltophilia]MCU1123856.1 hypothetical protein [Stenotrophomonas maltophilia]
MKAALTVSLLFAALAATPAAHATAPAIAPPGTATLEALLACKPGSNFSAADAIDALQAAGLAKKPAGTFEPEDKPVALFGGTVTGADVNVAEGEKSLFVYLNGVDAKRLARTWSVTGVNEHANTEEPSYVKRVDKHHTLHVAAGDDYEGYSAAVKCQISG